MDASSAGKLWRLGDSLSLTQQTTPRRSRADFLQGMPFGSVGFLFGLRNGDFFRVSRQHGNHFSLSLAPRDEMGKYAVRAGSSNANGPWRFKEVSR